MKIDKLMLMVIEGEAWSGRFFLNWLEFNFNILRDNVEIYYLFKSSIILKYNIKIFVRHRPPPKPPTVWNFRHVTQRGLTSHLFFFWSVVSLEFSLRKCNELLNTSCHTHPARTSRTHLPHVLVVACQLHSNSPSSPYRDNTSETTDQ